MSRQHMLAAAAFTAALFAPGLAMAQVDGGYPPGTTVAEIERLERAETERLNNEVLARDAQTVASNQASQTQADMAQAEYRAAQSAYAEAQARYEAEAAAVAEAQARYEADMAAWNRSMGRLPY